MAYQRGSLKKVPRKEGETWVLRYRVMNAEGRRVENIATVGLLRDFPKEQDAWKEVDRLGLLTRINSDAPCPARIKFDALAEHYLKSDFGADAVRPKSVNTIQAVERYVRNYLIPRWGNEIAEDIKPLDPAALAQIAAHGKRTRLDDDCEDARDHVAHLQDRHQA